MQVDHPPFLTGAASRPCSGEVVNGDAWQIDWHAGCCRIAVVDGLGHGQVAAQAAQVALASLAARPELAPVEALQVCHAALLHTRGAVISLVRVDSASGRLTFAGVGNVEARLWQGGRLQSLPPRRGILGARLPTLRALELGLADDWLLLLHTDGVSTHFDLPTLPEFAARAPQPLADAVLARAGRANDDATVLVACRV